MKNLTFSLDSLRRKPVYLETTHRSVGFVDDVIVDPMGGVLAVVSHDSHWGTWAFPFTYTRIADDGIAVVEQSRQSPRVFLREGRFYQELLGGKVLDADGAMIGRIKDIELVDVVTGDIAYRISPSGFAGLWKPPFSVASIDVGDASHQGIALRSAQREIAA